MIRSIKLDQLNAQQIRELKSTVYYTGAHFSNFPQFFSILEAGSFQDNNLIGHLVYTEMIDLISKKERILDVLNKFQSENSFLNAYESIGKTVREFFNVNDGIPQLFLVDDLPGEFASQQWDALAVDADDEKKLGIIKGIYYKRRFLTHPYFEFIICHELIHWAISSFSNSYYRFTSFIEEGVCDFISYYLLLRIGYVSIQVLTNFIIYNRSLKEQNDPFYFYYKASQYIGSIVSVSGIDFIVSAIKSGRKSINQLSLSNSIYTEVDRFCMTLNSSFSLANSVFVLRPIDYSIFKEIQDSGIGYINKENLKPNYIDDLSKIEGSLEHLVQLNLVKNISLQFYNSNESSLEKLIKFSICE